MTGRRLLVAAAALALVAATAPPTLDRLFPRGLAPISLGSTPEVDASAKPCAACHPAESAEWTASRHSLAWTNGIFQREFKREPLDWCVRCHAPLATGDASSVNNVTSEGVNCAVCHLRDGTMLAASKRANSPHNTVAVPGFGSSAYCAGCHQFEFPVIDEDHQVRGYTDWPMQSTVAEFRAGALVSHAGECYGCHGDTPGGHRFPGGHELDALQHALDLDICRLPRGTLRLTLTNAAAGHGVPTGDVHRALRLRAWRSTDPERLVETYFGRAFEPVPESQGKRVRLDTTIAPLASRSWIVDPAKLGGERGEAVNVELRYIYTADEEPTARNDPGEPTKAIVDSRRFNPEEEPPCPP